MTTVEILELVETKRRLDFDTKKEFAATLGMTTQAYIQWAKRLKSDKSHFGKLIDTLDKAGFEVIVKEKSK